MHPIDHSLREFVVKIATRCDLGCPACYYFTMADQSWRKQPRFMSLNVFRIAVEAIARYAAEHKLAEVRIILHGGEPLLAGKERLREFAELAYSAMPPGTMLRLSVQTNGTQLDDEMIRLLRYYRISVGVSLNGAEADNDRSRPFRNGSGSYAEVAPALVRLGHQLNRRIYGGILCTIDLKNPALTTYRTLISFAPPKLDFILPLGHWGELPPGRDDNPLNTPYADWLLRVFREWWYVTPAATRPSIRLFEQIIQPLVGRPGTAGFIGPSPSPSVVIEANGAVELVDALKSTFEGASATGLNVLKRGFSFDDFDALPEIRGRQRSSADLCATCRGCKLVEICGGGYQPHRYHPVDGFDNPSVYCADLASLITGIRIHLQTAIDVAETRAASRLVQVG